MPTVLLHDRGAVLVEGQDARTFLDGLVTCDIDRVTPDRARFGALLTPQGKILFDFIIALDPEGRYWLDVAKNKAADLARRLGFYKLRAKVAIQDRSDATAVTAGWGDAPRPAGAPAFEDPRLSALGWRAIGPAGPSAVRAGDGFVAYEAHRIALGVPEGGRDFAYGDAFPHETLMDQLAGVDFDKGCYVGQEVVSRMQHRGTARTRIVPLDYAEGAAAEPGAAVTAGERVIGTTGSASSGRGLATIRLDRAKDALDAGETIRAGGRPVRISKPDWIRFEVPG
jgi:folate-binding protein YgfZ